jgi:hypothetical protein
MKLNLKGGRSVELCGDGILADQQVDTKTARHLADIMRSGGYDAVNDTYVDWAEMSDTITAPDIRPLLTTSIEYSLREPLEPIMSIAPLFTRVAAKGLTVQVLAGAIGSNIVAAKYGELQNVPEQSMQLAGGIQVSTIDKYGVQASFSDEALMYTTFGIMEYNIRQMKAALTRLKETKAIDLFGYLGNPLFDNLNPTASHFGVTTGRGFAMTANGSLAIEDFFKGIVYMMQEGFMPTAIVINPMMYLTWTQDQTMRNLFLAGVLSPTDYFQSWVGNNGPRDPWSNGSLGGLGPSQGNKITPAGSLMGGAATGITGREHGMTSAPVIPNTLPWRLKVIISPFIPFDADLELGDIYLVSEGHVGFLLEDTAVKQVEWRDDAHEKTTIRLTERYSFAIADEGQGVGVFKNVKMVPNYWDGGVKVHWEGTLPTIAAGTPLSF